jgi:hypothetical protein
MPAWLIPPPRRRTVFPPDATKDPTTVELPN